MTDKLLYNGSEWTAESIATVYKEIEHIANTELNLNLFPMQIEIISADQMLDCYSSHGLPIHYFHWSFGKRHAHDEKSYKMGYTGLAYEIIINTDPCIAYLMENNTMTMQTLVLSHVMGHNHFFKNNHLFQLWTRPDFIVDYMKFAKNYILKCEALYGKEKVEEILDAAHALQYVSLDKYKRPAKPSKAALKEKHENREKEEQSSYRDIWKIIRNKSHLTLEPSERRKLEQRMKKEILPEPEENLLYFLEKKSPVLETWQREILRIVRKIGQYFYPQMQTQVMNEGFACFSHYYIMNRLYEKGMVSEGNMMEFFANHSNVVYQSMPDLRSDRQKAMDNRRGKPNPRPYTGINPYALGFAMMQDIRRICENPTEEDREWFPNLAGTDWKAALIDIVHNYRDESFIRQFLSPKVIRDFKLFAMNGTESDPDYLNVSGIHDEAGYKKVRKVLSEQYDINCKLPNIQVVGVDVMDTKKLHLRHYAVKNRILTEESVKTLQYVKLLWGFDVTLESVDEHMDYIDMYDTENLK